MFCIVLLLSCKVPKETPVLPKRQAQDTSYVFTQWWTDELLSNVW